jgi:hypothetical protein
MKPSRSINRPNVSEMSAADITGMFGTPEGKNLKVNFASTLTTIDLEKNELGKNNFRMGNKGSR